jgi:hypothetical protein
MPNPPAGRSFGGVARPRNGDRTPHQLVIRLPLSREFWHSSQETANFPLDPLLADTKSTAAGRP